MIKNKTTIEHIAGNRVFQFICDAESSIDLVKDALVKFLQYAGQIEDQVKEKAAKDAAEKEKPDIEPITENHEQTTSL